MDRTRPEVSLWRSNNSRLMVVHLFPDPTLAEPGLTARTVVQTATGGTVGVSSQWTFGTALLWGGLVVLVLYVLYRRFGYRPP